MTPLINHLTISKISIILYLTLRVSFAHNTFCVLVLFFFFFFWYCCYMTTMYNLFCTFLSCTFLLILIFKSTVYCHAHFFYVLYFVLYLIFFLFHFMYISSVVFYNICTVHGADLTHISLLVIYSLYNRVCDK